MKVQELSLNGLILISPKVFPDNRGFFYESFSEARYEEILNVSFVQDNLSFSKYGVIRGLHFQKEPYAQDKLVRCVKGKIYDIAVDIRVDSPSFGQYIGIELSDLNHLQFFIPKGFAHGFSVLSEEAIVEYKCSEYYNPTHDSGIYYNDPVLAIDWKIPINEHIVSEKDATLLKLSELHF